MEHRLLAIVTDDPLGPEPLREINPGGGHDRGSEVDLRVVVPAVEANAFRHTLGDIDEPKRKAEARLGRVLEELRANGIEAAGEVGDPDPIQAAQDALLKAPARRDRDLRARAGTGPMVRGRSAGEGRSRARAAAPSGRSAQRPNRRRACRRRRDRRPGDPGPSRGP